MSEKQLTWKKRLETCRESEMSIAAWCRQEDVNIHQMYYWKRKFDQDNQSDDEKPTDWVSLTSIGENNDMHSEIVIHFDRISVEIKSHVDRQLLSDVIHLLKYQ